MAACGALHHAQYAVGVLHAISRACAGASSGGRGKISWPGGSVTSFFDAMTAAVAGRETAYSDQGELRRLW